MKRIFIASCMICAILWLSVGVLCFSAPPKQTNATHKPKTPNPVTHKADYIMQRRYEMLEARVKDLEDRADDVEKLLKEKK